MPVSCIRHTGRRCGAGRRIASLLLSGLAFGFAPPSSILAETVQFSGQEIAGPHAADIADAAQRFGIPVAWVAAVLVAESAGNPVAVSSAGAMGLMQLMPDTWEELRIEHGLGDNPFLPRDNILAGTAYLRAMWDRYGNIGAMLAAYNAGPGRYDEYLTTGRDLPAETRAYVSTLAPVLGGKPLPSGTVAGTARITHWRDAPLFVTGLDGTQTAPILHSERSPDAPAAASAAAVNPLAPAPAEALFVARSPSGGAP
jgi:hypothetical protein